MSFLSVQELHAIFTPKLVDSLARHVARLCANPSFQSSHACLKHAWPCCSWDVGIQEEDRFIQNPPGKLRQASEPFEKQLSALLLHGLLHMFPVCKFHRLEH